MDRLKELIDRKYLKDNELLELEDSEYVIECKLIKPYNAHYNEYSVIIMYGDKRQEHTIYLKHR